MFVVNYTPSRPIPVSLTGGQLVLHQEVHRSAADPGASGVSYRYV